MNPGSSATSSAGNYASFEEVMQDFLYMDSTEVLRVLAAVFCIHHFKGVGPVWLFLIAPSSSAKTELLRPLSALPIVTDLSQLTPKTLVSGFIKGKGEDKKSSGLLERVSSKASRHGQDPLLIIKDFTTILNLRSEDRSSIMAQLREVKDGKLSGEYGNGVSSVWEGRMGLIAAVTDQIEEAIADSAKFGDRYIYYRMDTIDPEKAIERMIINRTRDTGELIKLASKHLEELANDAAKKFGKYGPLPPAYLTKTGGRINALSILATSLRTPVVRDAYRRDIIAVYPAESPTRHVSQLTSLASGFMATRDGQWSDEDYGLLRKLALGSAPVVKLKLAEALFNSSQLSTSECAEKLSLPKSAIRYPLDDLYVAGILRRQNPDKDEGHSEDVKSYIYSLSTETRELMLRAGYEQKQTTNPFTGPSVRTT